MTKYINRRRLMLPRTPDEFRIEHRCSEEDIALVRCLAIAMEGER